MEGRARPRLALAAVVLLAFLVVSGSGAALAAAPSAALAAAPSADDPVATVDGFLDTFTAQDVAGYGQFLCAERRDAFVARFDRSGFLGSLPVGVDGEAMLAAISMELADRVVALVTNDGTAATVALQGRFLMHVDDAAARAFIEQLLTAQGMVVTDAIVELTMPDLLTALGGQATSESGQPFHRTARLIVENGLWVICDEEFGFGDPEPSATGSPAPSTSG